MIKHGDADKLTRVFEAPSQDTIFLTGSRIAAGMIVRHHQRHRVESERIAGDIADRQVEPVGKGRSRVAHGQQPLARPEIGESEDFPGLPPDRREQRDCRCRIGNAGAARRGIEGRGTAPAS